MKTAKLRWSASMNKWLVIFDNGEQLFIDAITMHCETHTSEQEEGGVLKHHITIIYSTYEWIKPTHLLFKIF